MEWLANTIVTVTPTIYIMTSYEKSREKRI